MNTRKQNYFLAGCETTTKLLMQIRRGKKKNKNLTIGKSHDMELLNKYKVKEGQVARNDKMVF